MKGLFQYLESNYSKNTRMVEECLEDLLEKPVEGVEKANLPLLNGWVNGTGERASSNVQRLSFLFLDYDSGFSIQDFSTKYYKFKFYLYTSSSHTQEKHKFRVILPLEESVTVEEYKNGISYALGKFFPECDKTAFYLDHFFYIPSKNNNDYAYKINYGKSFNIKTELKKEILQSKLIQLDKRERIEIKEQYQKIQFQDKSEEIMKEFDSILSGGDGSGRYSKFFRLVGRYKKHYSTLLLDLFEFSGYKHKNQMKKLIESRNY